VSLPLPRSFDHLVGAGEHGRRHVEAERLGSPQIDHQFVLGRLLDPAGRAGSAEVDEGHRAGGVENSYFS
jgi:hypothetical protein